MGLEFFFTEGTWKPDAVILAELKISLDINSESGILALVEKCVLVSTGRFAF